MVKSHFVIRRGLRGARKPLGRSQAIAIPLAAPLFVDLVRKVPRHFLSLDGRVETASIAVVSDLRRRKGHRCGDEEGRAVDRYCSSASQRGNSEEVDTSLRRKEDYRNAIGVPLTAMTLMRVVLSLWRPLPRICSCLQDRRGRQLRFGRGIEWPPMKRKSAICKD